MFEIFNNSIYNNEANFLFITLYGFLLFSRTVVKSTQFPFHACLPDAATVVVAEMFLVAIIIAESKTYN